jgi:hypothetical protein
MQWSCTDIRNSHIKKYFRPRLDRIHLNEIRSDFPVHLERVNRGTVESFQFSPIYREPSYPRLIYLSHQVGHSPAPSTYTDAIRGYFRHLTTFLRTRNRSFPKEDPPVEEISRYSTPIPLRFPFLYDTVDSINRTVDIHLRFVLWKGREQEEKHAIATQTRWKIKRPG